MIKDLEDGKSILDCPDGPKAITGTLEVKKGGRGVGERLEKAILLALKMKEGAMSQGMWAPPEAGRGQETDSPLEPPEEGNPAPT